MHEDKLFTKIGELLKVQFFIFSHSPSITHAWCMTNTWHIHDMLMMHPWKNHYITTIHNHLSLSIDIWCTYNYHRPCPTMWAPNHIIIFVNIHVFFGKYMWRFGNDHKVSVPYLEEYTRYWRAIHQHRNSYLSTSSGMNYNYHLC